MIILSKLQIEKSQVLSKQILKFARTKPTHGHQTATVRNFRFESPMEVGKHLEMT